MTGTNSGFAEIKSRQQKAWSTGNYAVVGTTLQIVGEGLCELVRARGDQRRHEASLRSASRRIAPQNRA